MYLNTVFFRMKALFETGLTFFVVMNYIIIDPTGFVKIRLKILNFFENIFFPASLPIEAFFLI